MPELPEVETIRRDLKNLIVGSEISGVKVLNVKTVKGSAKKMISFLSGKNFKDLDRVGKLLIFKIANHDYCLLVHLKMTGQLIYTASGKITAGGHSFNREDLGVLPSKSTRVIIAFKNGGQLFFNDQRKFGYVQLVENKDLVKIRAKYGIEPLTKEFTFTSFSKAVTHRKKNIKSVLLDQQIIAGLGNIYADESLFLAGIRPQRLANRMTKIEIRRLYKVINVLIKKAIKYRGTTFSDYLDASGKKGNFSSLLQVYGRGGEKCLKCKGKIAKTKVASRGTHYCPKCQK